VPEERLTGGNMNAVWKSGDLVFRTAGPWTPTVHRLLRHIRQEGLLDVPEPVGVDDGGREILKFMPGQTPIYPLPPWVWSDRLLINAGRLLRVLHETTVDFPREDTIWRMPAHEPIEVICHNDFAPYNFVCEDGELTGIIDFDMASPGPRIWDLAYLAYRLCPLAGPSNPDARNDGGPFSIEDQERRLDLLIFVYGVRFTPKQVVETAVERLLDLAEFAEQRAFESGPAELAEHAFLYRNDAAELRSRLTD